METFSITQGCRRLLKAIDARRLTLRAEYFRAEPPQKNPYFPDPEWIERTPLYGVLLDDFGGRATCEWIARIAGDHYQPEWYVVRTDPDISPLDLDDWRMAATSQAEALGAVLEVMARIRATPTKVVEAEDRITIYGEQGPIAAVEKIPFADVDAANLRRATTALKGVLRWSPDAEIGKALSKIQGYGGLADTRHDDRHRLPDHECLHITPANLCTTLRRILALCVVDEVPRNVAQELLAAFFGFESWQHFLAKVKRRAHAAEQPYMIVDIDSTKDDYQATTYIRGLPGAVYLFGQRLKSEPRNTFSCYSVTHFYITNLTMADLDTSRHTGAFYREDRGITLHEMSLVYPEDEFIQLACALLNAPRSLEDCVKDYFMTGMDPRQRIVQFNARNGVKPVDHLFHGDWVYYVNREKPYGAFYADRIHGTRETLRAIGSSLHKAALVLKDGTYWLATNWDRGPKFELPGLDDEGARLLKEKFDIGVYGRDFFS